MKNVNDWLRTRTYHHTEFRDLKKLVRAKEKKNLSISVCFPTLNEEKTIGKSIVLMKAELMDRFPLIDEIAVVDAVQKLNQTVSKLTELVNDLTGQMSKVRHIPQDVSDIQEWIEEQKAEKAIDETEVERERKAGILYRLLDIASLGSGYEKDYDRIFTQEFGYNVNDTPVGEVDNVRKWIGDIIKGYWDGTA